MKKMMVALFSAFVVNAVAVDVVLEPVDFSGTSAFPLVKHYQAEDHGWTSAEPVFSIDENGIKAQGSFAVSDGFLHLHLVVNDDNHNPRGNSKTAWQGDSIQIGLDAIGDSPDEYVEPDFSVWDEQIEANNQKIESLRDSPKRWMIGNIEKANEKLEASKVKITTPAGRRNLLDLNDAKYTIALAKSGTVTVFADKHGQPGCSGLRNNVIADVVRDDVAKTTTYNLSFPWTEFGVPKQFSRTFQTMLMVNNTTEDAPERSVAIFGKSKFGMGSNFKPWYFHRFNTEESSAAFAEILVVKSSVYNGEDFAEILLGVSSGAKTFQISVNGETRTFEKNPDQKTIYKLRVNPQSMLPKSEVEIKINDAVFHTVILNESMADWWVWSPENSTEPSVIGMENWLDAPAGKFGRLQFEGNQFTFEKKEGPVKLWGVNVSYANSAPKTHEIADATAAHFAKYGVNIVRLHKFGYGKNSGIGDPNDATGWVPEKLDRMDYFVSKLKEKGIYVLIDPFFGFSVKEGNKDQVKYYEEAKKLKGTGLVNFAPDVQDLMIEKMTNLLRHKNPYTKLTYAEDPVVALVEMQNEDDLFWGNTMSVMMRAPNYRKDFAAQFVDWLLAKYGSAEKIHEAWGDALNQFSEFERDGVKESVESKYILPICNPWYLQINSIKKMQEEKNVTQRMQDTARFLYDTQSAYYAKYEKAIRATGYAGILEASCWQAGSDLPHYLNMHTDYKIGVIDRHNYYSGTGSWVMRAGPFNGTADFSSPGSGLISTGVQQVKDRPFMLSEWDANSPYQWRSATTTMVAYYGMGLQGWDGSMQFGAGLSGFTPTISAGGAVFNVEVPEGIGLYPALARTLYRGDIQEADIVSVRKVHLDSLQKGILDFTESVEQKGDLKVFTGDLPNEALAYGRTVVEFTDQAERSSFPDLSEMKSRKKIISQTGEMEWDYAISGKEHYTINTAGTKAFAGFAPDQEVEIGAVKLALKNRFATIILTSLEPGRTIEEAHELLLVCIARVRNTKMQYNPAETELTKVGFAPIVMEPVFATLTVPGAKSVRVLDHDGRATSKEIPVSPEGQFEVNGTQDKTMYYKITK